MESNLKTENLLYTLTLCLSGNVRDRQLQFWKAAKRSPPAKDIGVSSGEVQKAEIIPDFPKLVTIGSVGVKLFVKRLVWAH